MAVQKSPLLTEKVVDVIKKHIQDNFNEALLEDENKYADGIALEQVAPNSIYITEDVQALRLPAIYILFDEHDFDYSTRPNYMESRDKCVIVLTAEGIDASGLTRKLYRYAKVLFEILNLADLVDVQGAENRMKLKLIPQRLGYTRTVTNKLTQQEQRFRKDCVLELEIKHYEKNLTE